jgi:UDP-N-acetylmuramoyl-tripeptide--D-alanyl-D-alanine ligase
MTTKQLYTLFLEHPVISTDTRKIAASSLFFALKGENFDANQFAAKAIEAGAAYAVIDNPECKINDKYILVDDALTALQDLARYHRKQLTMPVIGLTGTNGKTTTKELINSVLSQHFKTQATQGNLNNHIGVPLSILTIDKSHEIAIIEMGANHQKEIEMLCTIAQPTHGLITNVGKAHLEGFGGVEGVKKGKGELYDYLKKKSESEEISGVAFVNSDSDALLEMQQTRGLQHVIFYGTNNIDNLVTGKLVENAPFLSLEWTNNDTSSDHRLKTQLTGAYNLDNILAAICIGVYFKLTDDEINKGIESYRPKNNRSQIELTKTNILICDYYNANPSSMLAAIENIGNLDAKRKVLILGDMFELGDESVAEHEAVIKKALEAAVDERIFIGKYFVEGSRAMGKSGIPELVGDNTNKGAEDKIRRSMFYETAEEAITGLKARPVKDSMILIKGSRGMALERLVGLF